MREFSTDLKALSVRLGVNLCLSEALDLFLTQALEPMAPQIEFSQALTPTHLILT